MRARQESLLGYVMLAAGTIQIFRYTILLYLVVGVDWPDHVEFAMYPAACFMIILIASHDTYCSNPNLAGDDQTLPI